jgi:hypothetical protein
MSRGGSGGGSKGGGQTVPYGGGNVGNNRFQQPQPIPQNSFVADGPNPYGAGNSLGSSVGRIMGDMRYNQNVGGYQGLQQQAFQQPQPFRQPMRYQQPMYQSFGGYNQPQYQPMPFRAPSPGKGGSKGGGMSVPRYPRNEVQPYRMPMQENPLGDRGMMRTMEMKPGRDYIPFMQPERQTNQMPRQMMQATNQGLGGFFR